MRTDPQRNNPFFYPTDYRPSARIAGETTDQPALFRGAGGRVVDPAAGLRSVGKGNRTQPVTCRVLDTDEGSSPAGRMFSDPLVGNGPNTPARPRGGDIGTGGVSRGCDRLLTVSEVAAVLSVARRWVYRHASSLPFARKLSPGVLRFSEAGLYRWIERRKP